MIEYGHFIGGKHVAGHERPHAATCSSRWTATVRGHGRARLQGRGARGGRERQGRAAGLGRDQPAAPRARADEVPRARRNRDYDELADCSRASTARPSPTPRATSSAASRWSKFAIGIPHLMKGEYTEGAGPGIDLYSMRQPLGVVAGITPFNFPAMIPLWKFAPAIACGNAFILKPSERDPGVPMLLAELFIEAGPARRHPQRRQRRQGSGRRHPRRSRHQGHRLRRLDADRRVHLRARLRGGQARAVLRRRQEPHDRHARRRHGPGGRCADRRRLRLGRRALHGDLGGGAGRHRRRPTCWWRS